MTVVWGLFHQTLEGEAIRLCKDAIQYLLKDPHLRESMMRFSKSVLQDKEMCAPMSFVLCLCLWACECVSMFV